MRTRTYKLTWNRKLRIRTQPRLTITPIQLTVTAAGHLRSSIDISIAQAGLIVNALNEAIQEDFESRLK